MIKINDISELTLSSKIQCTLNPEWGFGRVTKFLTDRESVQVLFEGKDLFDKKTGLKTINIKERTDVYKIH